MKTPHSPGPWSCAPNPYGRSDAEFCVYNENGNILSNSDETNEANARLIAAAPEMFDILERILRAHDSGNNGAVMGEAVLCRVFASQARDAISKAKGAA